MAQSTGFTARRAFRISIGLGLRVVQDNCLGILGCCFDENTEYLQLHNLTNQIIGSVELIWFGCVSLVSNARHFSSAGNTSERDKSGHVLLQQCKPYRTKLYIKYIYISIYYINNIYIYIISYGLKNEIHILCI